jgi:hypothetical protein
MRIWSSSDSGAERVRDSYVLLACCYTTCSVSVLPYCAKVFRPVEDRGLDLTHGGIIRLDAELIQKATSERFSK